jgi:hypothetical protein
MNDSIDRRNVELNVSQRTATSNIHCIWANDIHSASQESSWQLVHIWMSNNFMMYLKLCKRSERDNLVANAGTYYSASVFPFPFTNREMCLLIQMIQNCFVLKYMMCKILATGPICMVQSWSSEYVCIYAYFTHLHMCVLIYLRYLLVCLHMHVSMHELSTIHLHYTSVR